MTASLECPRRRLTPRVALFLGSVALAPYSMAVLPVLGPGLRQHFGMGISELGLLYAAVFVAGMIGMAIVGPLGDRFNRRTMICTALLCVAASNVLCSLGQKFAVFAAGVLAAGFFISAIGVALPAYMAHLYQGRARQTMALSYTVLAIPYVAFPFLVDRLLRAYPGRFPLVLYAPYAAVAIMVLAGTMIFLRAPSDRLPPTATPEGHVSLRDGLRQLSHPAMRLIIVLCIIHGASDVGFCYWFPTYAERQFSGALQHPGSVLALVGLAYLVSRSILVFLPERHGRRAMLIAPGILGGLILLAAIWLNRPAVLFWGYPLAALAWSSEFPALMGEAARRAPRYVSSVLAICTLATSAGTSAAVYVMGQFMRVAGDSAPWWMPDRRWAVTMSPLGFILFGVVAAVSGLGRAEASAPADRG